MRQFKITHSITNRNDLSLDKYLNEISKVSLVTPEEEVELAKRIQEGDEQALNQLTRANLRFVVSVSKQYQYQGLPLTDLINEGNVGLIKAARRFDHTKGFRFISYAVWWIRQSIMQALVENARMVRLPLNKIGTINKISKAATKFEQENFREPYIDELEGLTKIKSSVIRELINSSTRHVSMDVPAYDDSNASMLDLMVDDESDAPDLSLYQDSMRRELSSAMKVLSPREYGILSCFFGINGESKITLEEIGERFDLTRERVRQIKERSLRKLRKASRAKSLITYLA